VTRVHPMTELTLRNRAYAHRMAARGTPVEFISSWLEVDADTIRRYLALPCPEIETTDEDDSWMEQGVCRSVDPEIWFAGQGQTALVQTAKKICRTSCPVRDACLQWALSHGEMWGVWGGEDSSTRLRMMRRSGEAA